MKVKSVRYTADAKKYRLANKHVLVTQRYCCLGPGDDISVHGPRSVVATCINGTATILPPYSRNDVVQVGEREIRLTIKEPTSMRELDGYHKLEDYHYRGKVLHGRRVPLIALSADPLLPEVIGYIELATTFIMSRPRAHLFDHEFVDDTGKIGWDDWRKEAVRRYTNTVVRIARCVVSPEFRGLGIAPLLTRHAIAFAKKHWHVGRLKPLFIEITADMLRYVPFVESAGMHYIGETEGNLGRVRKDMDYLLTNFDRIVKHEILDKSAAGIVDLQVQYATHLKKIMKRQHLSTSRLLDLLVKSPEKLSDMHWGLLHSVLRRPKPTFIAGLSPAGKRFVRARRKALALPTEYPKFRPTASLPKLSSPIVVSDCSLNLESSLVRTKNTRKVQEAFGVSSDMLRTELFSRLSFEITPGDVVLLCGPSGAGKTTLLNLLRDALRMRGKLPRGAGGTVNVPMDAVVRSLEPLGDGRPLVDSLGTGAIDKALFALNVSGLAEAHLYVRRFHELSNGQRYRAMVARLIASEANVWIADEYCATLDPITANIVTRNLRRCAKQLGVTVIIAAANWGSFIDELRPDTVVHLRSPWECHVFRWISFQRAIAKSKALGSPAAGLGRSDAGN